MTKDWIAVSDSDALADGKAIEVLVSDRVLAIFRQGEQLFAIDGMCAHQGGPIAQGQLDGQCVTCPWHGWQYDITNGQNLLTGKRMLDCFAVELRGDAVWVEIAG